MLRRSSLVIVAAAIAATAATVLPFGPSYQLDARPSSSGVEPHPDSIHLPLCATACGAPVRDRSGRFKAMNLALSSVTLMIAGIRFVSKYLFSIRQGFGPDDWTMLAAGFVGIPCIIFNILGLTGHGLGKDVWTLTPNAVIAFTQWFLAMEVLYVVIMTIVKTSLSLFYLDLFPGTAFRKVVWGTIIFHIASGLSFVVGSVVQCVPLRLTWEQLGNSSSSQGHCINVNAFGWANAAVNVAVDLWLIGIPLFQLYKLDTNWRRKLSAAIMFLTGAIATIVSVLRFKSLVHFANSANPTWDQWSIAWWSTVEVNISIICTCLPSIRLILAHMFPRAIGSSLGLPPLSEDSWIGEKITNQNPLDVEELELCNNRSMDGVSKTSGSIQRADGILEG
ncbi:cfem domain-containing [Trichoderma arundinaceum]|uniref:Cfem domain-containing n=1 Tax=Trichoderma arundinaceum TaxID=490622 RepID=A0A395NNF3_TRIAR|nr:cfem domain-containing [Trichoderma arundinaceum]